MVLSMTGELIIKLNFCQWLAQNVMLKALDMRPMPTQSPTTVRVEDRWLTVEPEGQLSVDVYRQDGNIVVRSTIAGVEPEDLEIFLDRDILTIKGRRHHDETVERRDFIIRECYWGKFSRTIILPGDVHVGTTRATLKDGVLTIVMPPTTSSGNVPVQVIE